MTKAVVNGMPNSAHSPDLTPRATLGSLTPAANGVNGTNGSSASHAGHHGKAVVSPERQALDQRIVELVKLFRETTGDKKEEAFNELAPLAGRMAYHLALRSVADSSVAEDISQEALTRLYKHVGEIAGEGAFKTWFYRIVSNLVHDHFRRAVRQDSAKSTLEELRAVESKSRSEPLSNLERTGLRTALNEALACLDEKHREAFLMKEVQGLSHAEIAQTLDVPEGTVWSRLSYARRKLQEKLKRLGYGT